MMRRQALAMAGIAAAGMRCRAGVLQKEEGQCGAACEEGVRVLAPKGGIRPTGTWSLGARGGDVVYVAGMRGIDPKTNTLVQGDEARVRQAFANMELIAKSEGATLADAVRLVVYVTDMRRYRPIVNAVQEDLWQGGPYPPRTIIQVVALNQDDVVEVEGTFFAPQSSHQ